MRLYHGSKNIIQKPQYGVGNRHNDYGLGFYCTENKELAKEWACTSPLSAGFANEYLLDVSDLTILNLSDKPYSILNWLAVLLENRTFDTNTPLSISAKDYILQNFRVDTIHCDVIIGYRADDSYFSFARDFINGAISVRQLGKAMALGNLGEQVVLKAQKAFSKLTFISYEDALPEEYYVKRQARDEEARRTYLQGDLRRASLENDVFVLDIIRRGLKTGDEIL